MSQRKFCRLCVTDSDDFQSLYDENGYICEQYQLLVKYFDTNCLNMIQGSSFTVMCSKCWSQIICFYNFQQSVYEAQKKLLDEVVIKSELPIALQPHDRIWESEQCKKLRVKCEDECSVGCSTKRLYEFNDIPLKEQGAICLPKLEITDLFSGDDDSQTDKSENNVGDWLSEQHEVTASGVQNYDDDSIDLSSFESGETNNMLYISSDQKTSLNDCEINVNNVDRKQDYSKEKSTNYKNRDIEADEFIAQWKAKVECVLCSDSYPTYTLLRQHFKQKHPNKKFHIQCCQRKISRRSRLIDHIRFHIDPNIYKCEQCDRRINSRDGLINHRRFHKISSNDTADKAPKNVSSKTKKQLDLFIAQWKPTLECYLCSATCSSFTLLQRHFRRTHSQEEFYISCCQRKLKRRYEIEEHVQLHNDPNAFKCKQCDRCLSSRCHLRTHMRTYHSNTSDGTGQSKILNVNQSKKRNAFEVDEIIAQWKDNLECSLCGETFATFSSLRTHFDQSHTDETFFIKCCNRKLKKQFRILEHALFHVDPNAFKCDFCNKCFSTRNNRNAHVRSQHKKGASG